MAVTESYSIRVKGDTYRKIHRVRGERGGSVMEIVDIALDSLIAQQSGRRRANAPAQEGHLTNDPHGNPTTGGN
jgi:hypothetical protein